MSGKSADNLVPRCWTFISATGAEREFEKMCRPRERICERCEYWNKGSKCYWKWAYELVEKPGWMREPEPVAREVKRVPIRVVKIVQRRAAK